MSAKRLLDISLSSLALLLLAPLFIILGLAVKLHDGGSMIYAGRRVGRYGKEFRLYKFRSMIVPKGDNLDKGAWSGLTLGKDPRITPIGRFLRKSKLDELPQLFNVLRGDMSLVGPRPEDPHYLQYYTEEQRRLLALRPGITSLASIAYRDEEKLLGKATWESDYIHEILPKKLAIELEYLEKATIFLDLQIMLKTVLAIMDRKRD